MSVLDRMHRQERATKQQALTAGGSDANGLSTIQAVRSPIIDRLQYVVDSLHKYIAANDDSGTMARFSFIARAMIEEIGEELQDRDEATLQAHMEQIGEVIAWIGHGDPNRVPSHLRQLMSDRPEIEAAS